MNLTLALALLAGTAFPSSSQTSWMSPESFRLAIGMTRAEAVKTLQQSGWGVKPGKKATELVIDYSDERSLTLDFRRDRLRSIRFELFSLIPVVRAAFAEQKTLLVKQFGDPPKASRSDTIVLYDDRLPNIMVVLSADPKSEYGRKGVGYLAVRYYDPAAK